MREIVLYIAMSLDGYIADAAGGVDWLGGEDAAYCGDHGYRELLANADTVLMGYLAGNREQRSRSTCAQPSRKTA